MHLVSRAQDRPMTHDRTRQRLLETFGGRRWSAEASARHRTCAYSSPQRHPGGAFPFAARHGKFAEWTTTCLVGRIGSAQRRTCTYLCVCPRFQEGSIFMTKPRSFRFLTAGG